MSAVFQLYPLSFTDHVLEHIIPSQSIDCSKIAMTILQVIYMLTEQRVRNCELQLLIHNFFQFICFNSFGIA
jgi:hypothetical protein